MINCKKGMIVKKYLILFALILIQGCSSGGDSTVTTGVTDTADTADITDTAQ